jgi:cytochrome c peroxidase
MSQLRRVSGFIALVLAAVVSGACSDDQTPLMAPAAVRVAALTSLTDAEQLGRAIFFDHRLSLKGNQSCASCHGPDYGFTGPQPGVNRAGGVYMGSVRARAGDRKPPAAAYATFSPQLHYDASDEVWVGGNFWDGRATGAVLGNPAADQAIGPFLNPVEQALPDAICVLYGIANGQYAELWQEVYGNDLRSLPYPAGLDRACRREGEIDYPAQLATQVAENYGRVGLAIMAYEASREVNSFSSKYDAYLRGETGLSAEELRGLALFNGKAMCAACHPSEGTEALFTDYTYDNLGLPANPLNPVYQRNPQFIDRGLGAYLQDPAFDGAFKVPTLRNVARGPGGAPKAFGHNGVFKSLEQIVHFYNTRDVLRRCEPQEIPTTAAGLAKLGFSPACWPAPEVAENVNTEELGDLGLTPQEENDVVAYLRTLSDGWR